MWWIACQWDELLKDELLPRWQACESELPDLQTVIIPWCYLPTSQPKNWRCTFSVKHQRKHLNLLLPGVVFATSHPTSPLSWHNHGLHPKHQLLISHFKLSFIFFSSKRPHVVSLHVYTTFTSFTIHAKVKWIMNHESWRKLLKKIKPLVNVT